MESFTSLKSSDSESSYLSFQYNNSSYDLRPCESASQILNMSRHSSSQYSLYSKDITNSLCPTNILKIGLRRTRFAGSATASICVLN